LPTSQVARIWSEPQAGYGFFADAIADARSSIDLSMYEFADTALERDLTARAAAGVDVRVILDSAYHGASENSSAARLLSAGGVHVVWAAPSQIFHAKYLVVDGTAAYIGTGNLIASEYSSTRDFWVLDTDASDVVAIATTFNSDFSGVSAAGTSSGGLVWSPGSTSALVSLMSSAHHSLLVENEEMDSTQIESSLVAAVRRGVDVEVVMTSDSEWTAALSALERGGVHVRLLGYSQLYIHAKVICADCTATSGVAFVGSENFSTASLVYNRELGVLTTTRQVVRAIRTAVIADGRLGLGLR
jgi:phosphatidylserine/phosphatidylglycerophosphate/cardiolipin synthase-like enzyme